MTNETKQTAVEQLFIEMLEIQQSGKTLTFDENVDLLNKYKEIEKDQMLECYLKADVFPRKYEFEKYYTETYLKL